jgi:HipA-like protein
MPGYKRRASVFMHGRLAGILEELVPGREYNFIYKEGYDGPSISLTMPTAQPVYEFSRFPSFF